MIWLCALLAAAVIILGIKLHCVRTAAREIREGLEEKLNSDTNTVLSVSTSDREMRALAAGLNRQLRLLRDQRQKYLHGDRELKEAVTSISHDLRTPLTAICGYLDLLDREDTSPAVRRYLSIIRSRTNAMRSLTEELLRYSVITAAPALTLENMDLRPVLEESLAGFYAALTARGIVPAVRIPEEPVCRPLNREALARVFSNIVSNCLKYSDGDLDVTLDSREIRFSNRASALDSVQVGRLFDRFFSVETGQDSTGLGLAISRTLMEQMGGAITAEYREGRFVVSVRLP